MNPSRLPVRTALFSLSTIAVLACGGGKSSDSGGGGGNTTGESTGEGGGGEAGAPGGDAGPGEAPMADAGPPPAAVTFVLKNSHTEELAFSMNKGWGANIFAFTGKPPKATSYVLFPAYCTASCDAPDEERCPYCPEPETAKEKIAAQKFEKVAPDGTLEVPWDGKALVYEKGKGTRDGKAKKCQCYRMSDPPPGEYTVRVCGLRLTKEVGTDSTLQCVDSTVTLPTDRIEVDFPAPPCVPTKKKKCP
ncbi:MAG TPA: hypothetical protein VMZ28_08435 [Kofleriaceae bacterium]|nr:hypothetical protein [Kofleriaceae bacterium]